MRFSRKYLRFRFIIYAAISLIFYNEFVVYWLSTLKYPQIESNGTRFFLIAGPQLIGDNDEPLFLKSIAKWDSDRYLHKTYQLARKFAKPDIIIFLGDIFDEGVKSNNEQFNGYQKRFEKIFELDATNSKRLIICAGDNDIGGEYNDRTEILEKRFEQYFGSLVDLVKFKNTSFLKLDFDNGVVYSNEKRDHIRKLIHYEKSDRDHNYMIIVNHLSIIKNRKSDEVLNLINDSNAGLIIKGDDHKLSLTKHIISTDSFISYNVNSSKMYNFDLQKSNNKIGTFYELSIPTCSYRMGVPEMGYGLMTITQDGNVNFSPSQ